MRCLSPVACFPVARLILIFTSSVWQPRKDAKSAKETQRKHSFHGSTRVRNTSSQHSTLLVASFREHSLNREMHFIEETVCLKAHFMQRAIATFCKNSNDGETKQMFTSSAHTLRQCAYLTNGSARDSSSPDHMTAARDDASRGVVGE